MPLQSLREQFGTGIDRLIGSGAASPGRALSIVKCSACFEDHPAEIEYDDATSRSSIFCPEAGRVWIENRDLGTVKLNPSWLPDQLAKALNIAPSPPRRTIIEGAAWLLGDTTIGTTKVAVALAVCVVGTAELEQLVEGLGRRQPLEVGVLLAAGCKLSSLINKASKYSALSIKEIATFDRSDVQIDRARLGGWIKSFAEGRPRRVLSHGGRPPMQQQIMHVFEVRRRRGEPYTGKSREAKAFAQDWRSLYPNEKLPGSSTIRSYLPEPNNL